MKRGPHGAAQRWRDGVDSYRPHDDEYIDTRHYEIAEIAGPGSDTVCRAFLRRHHYLRTLPAARFRYGLYDRRTHQLAGVAVFSIAGSQAVAKASFPFLDPARVLCLGRLVLLDDVRKDGESWFVAECHRRLYHDHGIAGVISYSDPVPRRTAGGVLVMPGHVGVIYTALNSVYLGRTKAETKRLFRDDCSSPDARSLSKIRARAAGKIDPVKVEGWEGAVARLVAHGASEPEVLEGPGLREWMNRELERICVRFRHNGNHRYVFGLDRRVKRHLHRHYEIEGLSGNHEDYPQAVDAEVAA